MAYDERVAQRVRKVLSKHPGVVEKKMFGGLAFLLHGHMCCGVVGGDLMVRVGPAAYDAALLQPHARKMDFTGKPLKGFVYVAPAGFASPAELGVWVARGADFASSLPSKRPRTRKRKTGTSEALVGAVDQDDERSCGAGSQWRHGHSHE